MNNLTVAQQTPIEIALGIDENGMTTARKLYEKLNECKNFEDFFVEVCKIKVESDFEELSRLMDVVEMFICKYSRTSIIYLKDCISAERCIPCKSKDAYKQGEQNMKNEILNNFQSIFPDFKFICVEKVIPGIGRADIYAEHGKTPVIMELKVGRKNPSSQLLAYGSAFENPTLIGITEEPLSASNRIDEKITYYTLSELRGGVAEWIV